jgi:hypothetical protein
MTFLTDESLARLGSLRYRIYVGYELVAMTSLLKGAEAFVRPFVEDIEYIGVSIIVKDAYEDDMVIIRKTGGSEPVKSADILPFPRRS